MNRTKKIIILLAAIGLMCGVVSGFLPVFQDAFHVGTAAAQSRPTETVYYAPLETQAVTEPTAATLPLENIAPDGAWLRMEKYTMPQISAAPHRPRAM